MDNFTQTPQVKSVEIQSMTVSIQIMAVNNKQMTLSVFRQLPEKKCFDEQGYSVGNWWGWVNYPFGNYKNGFWIVFELDGILYKNWNHEISSYIQDMADKKKEIERGISGCIKILLAHVYSEETSSLRNQVVRTGAGKLQLKEDPSHILHEVTGINIDKDICINFSIDFSPILYPRLIAEIPSIGWKKDILTFSDYDDQDTPIRCQLYYSNYIYLFDQKLFAGVHPDSKRHPIQSIQIMSPRDSIIDLSIHLQIEERLHQLIKRISLLPQIFIAL